MKHVLKRIIVTLAISSLGHTPLLAAGSTENPFFEAESQNPPRKVQQESSAKAFWRDHKGKIIVGGVLVVAALTIVGFLVKKKQNDLQELNEYLIESKASIWSSNNSLKENLWGLLYHSAINDELKKDKSEFDKSHPLSDPLKREEIQKRNDVLLNKCLNGGAKIFGYNNVAEWNGGVPYFIRRYDETLPKLQTE